MVATLLPLREEDFLNYCVLKIAMTKSNSQRRIMQITMYAFECIILRKNQCVGAPRVIHKLHLSINPGQKIDAKISKQTSNYINGVLVMLYALTIFQITEIKNADLKFCSSFNKGTCKMIVGFLNHIQGPICAISHNRYGNEFQQLLSHIRLHGFVSFLIFLVFFNVCVTFRMFQRTSFMLTFPQLLEELMHLDTSTTLWMAYTKSCLERIVPIEATTVKTKSSACAELYFTMGKSFANRFFIQLNRLESRQYFKMMKKDEVHMLLIYNNYLF